jgi:hypothetical protein
MVAALVRFASSTSCRRSAVDAPDVLQEGCSESSRTQVSRLFVSSGVMLDGA